ncbi:MAG TPA: fibrinogen-like YCDxxxxGGGW domain-containing protein [Brachybacterium sp.]|nr:fibrinogen-like YCDxxxxGGGW domain-containing protein [Brachybacterium sp.]
MSTTTPAPAPRPSLMSLVGRSLPGLLVALATMMPLAAVAAPGTDALDAEDSPPRPAAMVPASLGTTAASDASPDGLSEGTAAASCWEIKQRDPSSTDGVYWLVTPELGAPQQFYCDQSTDGGGWVLIGRGREHWTQSNEGRLSPSDITQNPTGISAFSPAQLPVDTVNGLLNDGAIDELTEGVRLRRALTTDGTSWQEVRFRYSTPRDDWSWQFAGLQGVSTWQMDSLSGGGGNTGSFGSGSAYQRVDTTVGSSQGWARGFSYGSSARGSSSASSYVWASSPTSGYPRPFTQVFLRPRLMSQDIFTSIPDDGLPESTQVATAQSYPLPTPWGVSGLGAAGGGELNTEVSDFAESNGVMYVGGNFRYVQRDANGTGRVEQSYLAAFDVATGEWLPSFRPALNNQVKAIEVLPDGRIAVGGSFSTASGQPSAAFAVLDPETGAADPSVTTRIINYTGGVPPQIRTMDLQGDYLYLGGRFTHLTGGGVTSEIYRRNIGRLDVATLAPGAGWDPMLDGTVVSVDASEHGDQVYAAGYFGLSQWTHETPRAGAFTAQDATVIPWEVDFSNTAGGRLGYQQAVAEVGDRVWLGGSEHMLFSYDRSTMQELSTNITQNGGDFQAVAPYGEDGVAAGCHCSENVYEGARKWPGITGFTRVEHIDQVGIWRASDGAYAPEYSPQVSLRSGYGAWAIQEASDGSLWVGGDYTYARGKNTQNQWTGAFVRFAPTDATAPAVPQDLTASSSEGTVQLNWQGVDDATYEVLREDRVVATTASVSLSLPALEDPGRYFVRAVDAAENRSATSPVAVPEVVDPGTLPVTAIPAGGEWTYRYETAVPEADWTSTGFDDSDWADGTAPLGWGHGDLGTELTVEGTKPLTAYFRRSFTVEDATQIAALELTTRADDGIVVYVNGTEVTRQNMPDGAIGHGTYATAAPTAAAALANPVHVTVPGNLVVTGENVVTAEVHLNYRSTPTVSYDLGATLVPGDQPAPEPEPDPDPEPEPGSPVLLAAGSEWAYRYQSDAPDGDWTASEFDDSGWDTGAAPLGWGHGDLGTELTFQGTKPLTAYFRRSITIEDVTDVAGLELTTRADDGVVVYLNGTEVARQNMPNGTIGHGTYATTAPSSATALANPVTVTVPEDLLVSGENVITAEVHLNYRGTPSASFELIAEAVEGGPQALAEPASEVLAAQPPGGGAEGTSPEGPAELSAETEEPAAPEQSSQDAPESTDAPERPSQDAPETADAPEESAEEEADASATTCEATAVPPQDRTAPAEDDSAADEEVAADPDEVIAPGSEWALDCGTFTDRSPEDSKVWTDTGFDEETWSVGAAPLGWGGDEQQFGTVLSLDGGVPQSARFRRTLELDDLEGVRSLQLTLPADADIRVHVNGVEVVLPEEADPSTGSDAAPTRTVAVPAEALVEGENSIAVEVVPGKNELESFSFDARGVLERDTA